MEKTVRRRVRSREQTAFARQLRRNTSKTERRLWPYLRGEGMGAPFRRQEPIGKYFADYCCLPLRLVIEVDGPWHDSDSDTLRDIEMRRLGFDVVRFSSEEVACRLDQVVESIHSAVQQKLMAKKYGARSENPNAATPS